MPDHKGSLPSKLGTHHIDCHKMGRNERDNAAGCQNTTRTTTAGGFHFH